MSVGPFENYIKVKLCELLKLYVTNLDRFKEISNELNNPSISVDVKKLEAELYKEYEELKAITMPQISGEIKNIYQIIELKEESGSDSSGSDNSGSDEDKSSGDETNSGTEGIIDLPTIVKSQKKRTLAEKQKYMDSVNCTVKNNKVKVDGKQYKSIEMQAVGKFKSRYYKTFLDYNIQSKLPRRDIYHMYRRKIGDIWKNMTEEEKYKKLTCSLEEDSLLINKDWMKI